MGGGECVFGKGPAGGGRGRGRGHLPGPTGLQGQILEDVNFTLHAYLSEEGKNNRKQTHTLVLLP